MLVVQSISPHSATGPFEGHCLSIGTSKTWLVFELCFVFDDHRVMVIDGAIYDWFHEELYLMGNDRKGFCGDGI